MKRIAAAASACLLGLLLCGNSPALGSEDQHQPIFYGEGQELQAIDAWVARTERQKKQLVVAEKVEAAAAKVAYASPAPAAPKSSDNNPNGEIRNAAGTQRLVFHNEAGRFDWEDIPNEFQNDGNISPRRQGTVWKSSLPQKLWEPYGIEFKKGQSTVFYGEVSQGFYPDPKNVRIYRAMGRLSDTTKLYEAAVVPVPEKKRTGKRTQRVAVLVDGVCPDNTNFVLTDICPAENMADRGRLPWGNFEGQSGELLSGRTLERDPRFGAKFASAVGTEVSKLTRTQMNETQRDQFLRDKLGFDLFKVEPHRYIYFALRGEGVEKTIARLMAENAGINWGDQFVRALGAGYPVPHPAAAGASVVMGLGKSILTPSKMPRLSKEEREALLNGRYEESSSVHSGNSTEGRRSDRRYAASKYSAHSAVGRQVSANEFIWQNDAQWVTSEPYAWLYHPKNNLANGEFDKPVFGGGYERYKEAGGTSRTKYGYFNSVILPEFLGFEPIPGSSWVNFGLASAVSGHQGKFKANNGTYYPYKGDRWGIGSGMAAGFNFQDGSWLQVTSAVTFGSKTNPQGANLARVGSTQYEAEINYGKDWAVTGNVSWLPGFRLGVFGDNRRIQSYGHIKLLRTLEDEVQVSMTATNIRKSTAPGVFVEFLRGGIWAGASLDSIRCGWSVGGNPVKVVDYLSEMRYRSFVAKLPKGCLPNDASRYEQ